MAQQENGAKEAEQRRKPSDCVNNRSGHLASQRRVHSRDPLARNHEDEFVPDGQITKNSSTPIAKNIPLSPSGKSVLSARAIPFREEGRWPSSRTLGRDAVDATASGAKRDRRAIFRERSCGAQDERCGCVRQSRVVLAPVAGVKLAEVFRTRPGFRSTVNPSATVTRRIRRRGEHVISRKPIAQGIFRRKNAK